MGSDARLGSTNSFVGRELGAILSAAAVIGDEFEIYVPAPSTFDSIIVGYYDGANLTYVARIRSGFVPALRQKVFAQFSGLELAKCPFVNLPERGKGRWGEGLTAEDMKQCRWLRPHLVASIEFLVRGT